MNFKAFTRKHVTLAALAVSAAVALPLLSPAEAAPPSYDGLWSVVIMTQQGICEPSYRAPIRISKGHIVDAGGASFTLQGRVGKNGAVVVQVTQGADKRDRQRRDFNATRGGGFLERRAVLGVWHAEKRA